jgi:hypothetical protein
MRCLCLDCLSILGLAPFAAPSAAQQRRQEAPQSQEKILIKAGKLVDVRAALDKMLFVMKGGVVYKGK